VFVTQRGEQPEVFVPTEKRIHDLLDLLRMVGIPMTEARRA
jgi:hypothetical protein